MTASLLYCADPLRAGRVDPVFAEEATRAGAYGVTRALLDHDALLAGDLARALARVERGSGPYWYRGWMMLRRWCTRRWSERWPSEDAPC